MMIGRAIDDAPAAAQLCRHSIVAEADSGYRALIAQRSADAFVGTITRA